MRQARRIGVLAALIALLSSGALAQSAPSLSLGLPLDCTPGETCWISNYVDHDPGQGVRDYMCGTATYNLKSRDGERHLGTDFALRDLAAMKSGVGALAVAAGTVAGVRDGMADIDVKRLGAEKLKGKFCGNGLVIEHAGTYSTQYCHLRRGSITVKQGERVAAGQKIGLVGLSGLTQYPHLHVTVRHGKTVVDPFVGLTRKKKCGPGAKPLWRDDVLAALPYGPSALYNVGFAGEQPTAEKIRAGEYRDIEIARTAPLLIFWVDAFQVRQDDELTFLILGPDGKPFLKRKIVLKKQYARMLNFAGKRLESLPLEPGTYTGIALLTRKNPGPGQKTFTRHARITVK
ncbi:MAG: M23 family metallopeptidase [Rhodospirillales bacterium]